MTAYVDAPVDPPTGARCKLVPKAINACDNVVGETVEALQSVAVVASSLTVIDVGTAGVSVLLISCRAEVV